VHGDLAGAEVKLVRLLNAPPQDYAAIGVDTGLRVKARHNLAVLYRDLGRFAEAETQWRQVLIEDPEYHEAKVGVAGLPGTHHSPLTTHHSPPHVSLCMIVKN